MSARSADSAFASLKDFQRRTVDHVLDRLYDAPDSTGRFLVADEVGMGKTMVARGVIAGAIERLDREDSIQRIDIIYICSNSAIARQNVRKLDVLGTGSRPLNTRITMLASQVHDLNKHDGDEKTVNIIAITPGTSFEKGFARGKVEERALIFEMIQELFPDSRRALRCLLKMNVTDRTWSYHVSQTAEPGKIDAAIRSRLLEEIRTPAVWGLLVSVLESLKGKSKIPKSDHHQATAAVGALRSALAKVSIDALEPDLVILDEFQRFKHLLETPQEDSDGDDIRRLAQQLFNYPDARVLLLSATPYKLFTVSGEEELSGDNHYKDFLATMRFLVREDAGSVAAIESTFAAYRRALIDGRSVETFRISAQDQLTRVMSRTERPTIGESHMGSEAAPMLDSPLNDELLGYAAMDRMAMELGTTMPVEYWKSAPYFLNFMDGYKIGEKVKEHIEEGGRALLPKHAQIIQPRQILHRHEVEPGNARLRRLQNELIDSGVWKLLWLPPSLPYLEAGGPYRSVNTATATKRLIFSSWAAAPNSIAALLSHEVARRIFAEMDENANPYDRSRRLEFRTGDEASRGMTTLALVTPVPELARLTDPLAMVRDNGGVPVAADAAMRTAAEALAPHMPTPRTSVGKMSRESWYGAAPFLMATNRDSLMSLVELGAEDEALPEEPSARRESLETAAGLSMESLGVPPDDLRETLAMIGMFGLGNVAYRALVRTTHSISPSEETLIRAAAIIGEGFRSLFNRPEAMSLVDMTHPESEGPYWRRVLSYCMDGDIQAVLDEYLHHLVGNASPSTDNDILDLANAIRESMSLKTSPVHLFNPKSPRKGFNVNTRFAVRYGSARGQAKADEKSENRMSAVQQAFNSPFWPMVLASTSVGQEGVDFHWWCHSLVHWNLPSNPVDLEQREGRIHRFGGHAVRKNVASAFRSSLTASDDANPWSALFDAAVAARPEGVKEAIGDLWPWWVFPGEAKIQTWSPALPFSKDIERDARLRRLRGIYRLAFGQPRQEELLSLLDEAASNFTPLDLRPPRRDGSAG